MIMSAVQEVSTAPVIDAVPKKAMALGPVASLVILALLIATPLFVKNFFIFQMTMWLIYAIAVLGNVSGTFTIPEHCQILDFIVDNDVVWNAAVSAPLMGRTSPLNESSPKTSSVASRSMGIWPDAASTPSAMGRSKRPPSFGRSAGARLTVILRLGNL